MELFSHGYFAWSASFLSMIFGFLGKFRIDLGVQKNFRIFISWWKKSQKIRNLDTFDALLNLYKELKHSLYKFYKGNASIPYINSKVPQKCQDFGFLRSFFISKKIQTFFGTPMSIRNFPRIPKIILRTPADQTKEPCEKSSIYFSLIAILGVPNFRNPLYTIL